MRFEPLNEPYDMYAITDEGHVFHLDKERYERELMDPKNGKMYVVLEGSHKKSRKFYVSQLVADMFVRNEHNLGYLYFKDGNVQNSHYTNIGYAINPKEGVQRVARPFRKKVEAKRHALIVAIGQACDYKDFKEANRLGRELWELEGASYDNRNHEF